MQPKAIIILIYKKTHLKQLVQGDFELINYYLKSLSSYLYSCQSRVHASQCTAVCFETLLKIQELSKDKKIPEQHNFVTIHYLLEIFDYIMEGPERHPILMEYFYHFLIENAENFEWTSEYSESLFFKTNTEEKVEIESEIELDMGQQNPEKDTAPTKEEKRWRVFKHFEVRPCGIRIPAAMDDYNNNNNNL